MEKIKSIAFFGHRDINDKDLEKELINILVELIQQGFKIFKIGVHGDFDFLAFKVCKNLKKIYQDIKILIVSTSFSIFKKDSLINILYEDFEIITYPIENVYYKNKIWISNKYMIEDSDLLLCYVDIKKEGGAKRAMLYGLKIGKEVINLYKKTKCEHFCIKFFNFVSHFVFFNTNLEIFLELIFIFINLMIKNLG